MRKALLSPSSDLKGSVNLVTALKAAKDTINFITPIVLSKIELTTMELYNVQKYIFDNVLTEKINDQKKFARLRKKGGN